MPYPSSPFPNLQFSIFNLQPPSPPHVIITSKPMITLPRSVCVNLDQALNKEWLVSNGIGGFASSTVSGINTRRYHALLVASLKPPVERTVLFSNIDEDVEIDGRSYYLGEIGRAHV